MVDIHCFCLDRWSSWSTIVLIASLHTLSYPFWQPPSPWHRYSTLVRQSRYINTSLNEFFVQTSRKPSFFEHNDSQTIDTFVKLGYGVLPAWAFDLSEH